MKIVFNIAIFLVCCFQLGLSLAASDKDIQIYRDKDYRFILQYPATWSQVPSTHQGTRIKIVSENGDGDQDCMVNVQKTKKTSTKEFLRSAPSAKEHERILRNVLPDVKVIKRGETYISNQGAIYYIIDSIFKSVGIEVPMRQFMIVTAKNEHLYTVTCRATQEEFEQYLPDFQIVFAGFLIWQNP
jgi:hypothetical protein